MKILWIALMVFSLHTACREQKKDETMMPVEADGGIGDGAVPLDSLLQQQKEKLPIHQKKDSI